MSSFFPTRDHSGDAWFRLGRLDVTTTNLVVGIGTISMLACLFVPGLLGWLALTTATVFAQPWSPFTWPLANGFEGLWGVLTLFMLWYFGTDLENTIGRRGMRTLLVGTWGALTVTTLLLGFFVPGALVGLRMIQFAVLLVWIAEYPRRRFLFNIPAWVFGAVILALQILPLLAQGQFGALLSLLLSLFLVAVVAKRVGLLSELTWLPGGRRASRPPPAPRPNRAEQRQQRRRASDEERLDDLLGKISAQGIHALSKSERAELEKLRERRRR